MAKTEINKIELLEKEIRQKGYSIKTADKLLDDKKIKTGIFALDYVLDGGISQCEGGHRIEIWGAESSGKSTFALFIIKKYQELGKTCFFLDAERSYDKTWGAMLGVNNKDLLVTYTDTLEEAGNLLVDIIPSADLIVIDSLISLIPEAEAEKNTEEAQMALQARINALIVRKIYGTIKERPITLVFINQLRQKLGVMYGNPNIASGGYALKHMYNTRIEFRAGKPIKDENEKEKIGLEINLNCIKNKRGKPYRTAVVDFYLDGTLDNKKSLLYAGIQYGVIELNGKTYMFGNKKEVGLENFSIILEDKDYKKIEEEIWKKLGDKK